MNNLIKMFPDATKKDRVIPVKYYGPNDPEFHKSFWKEVWSIFWIVGVFTIAGITLLFLLGALKALGVKSLEP